MAIVAALIEAVPMLKKMIADPNKGKDLAKKVSDLACHITQKSTPTDVLSSLQQNPELFIEFHKKLMETEKEMYLATLNDRASARQRTTPGNSRFMLFLSLAGLVSCLTLLATGQLSPEVTTLLSTASGIFGACVKDIYAFEFSGKRE